MDDVRVCLTEDEQRIAKFIARRRQESNDTQGVNDSRVTAGQSSVSIHEDGFAAELAFCKLFNVYPDFEIRPRRGSADCSRFGETIDVKATRYQNGKLLAVAWKETCAADVYALMILEDGARFRFAGFARATDLIAPERLTNLGHGPTYALEQQQLRGHLALPFERRRASK